jgi:predicted MFS family arabinose efflux permease
MTVVAPKLAHPPATMTTTPAKVRGRFRAMPAFGGALLLDNAEMGTISVLFPTIRHSFGLSLSALGVLGLAARIVSVLFGPVWVWLANRTSRKAVLVVACGLWSGWGIAAGFAQNFGQLLLFYLLLAAGFAGAEPIVNGILADLYDGPARGRAVGCLYGSLALGGAVVMPAIGQLARIHDGWRVGLWALGGIGIAMGLLVLIFFRDPGIGATERQLAGRVPARRRATRAELAALLRIPTFRLMLCSRLLSGHLLVLSFGVVFLVEVHHFSNAVAALVILPFGVGYFCGSITGGAVGDRLHLHRPRGGRIFLLQLAQALFAVVAFLGTQLDWHGIAVFGAFFAGMGFLQGVNPGVNRPIIMAVTPPELRCAAFAIFISIFDGITWGAYQFAAGYLGDIIGLRTVFLVILVGAMLLNAALITLLYRPYPRDVANLQRLLDERAALPD